MLLVLAVGIGVGLRFWETPGEPDDAVSASGSASTEPAAASPSPTALPSSATSATSTTSATSAPTAAVVPPSTTSAQEALADLDALPASSGRWSDYDRDRFGQAWFDVDRNGCDTRNDILGRDLVDPVFKADTNGCKVLQGVLVDPYDDERIDFVSGTTTSGLVQIDHVVALAWAWRSGADTWTDEQRVAFANDPANLLASSAAMNQGKSDSGPATWLPPVAERSCAYVERVVHVLSTYGLSIDEPDRAASRDVLTRC